MPTLQKSEKTILIGTRSGCAMSSVEQRQCQATIQRLKKRVDRLSERQTAAERRAALEGMTIDDSKCYKERHSRIKKLVKEIAALDDPGGRS